ncbi:MAG TPA: hypothetical protein VGE93_03180, partial [Bryobacteraceae bacterium]
HTVLQEGRYMRFSERFAVGIGQDDDWFDPLLTTDTKLFVDPFLIWEEKDGPWARAHEHLLDFYEMIFALVRDSKGNEDHISWKQASRLLIFPEPAEFCLGVAEGTPLGSGSGKGLQREMLDGIRTATGFGMSRVAHTEIVSLFQGGMGIDRISDMTCNILKRYFVEYTQEICRRHEIPMREIEVRNLDWSEEFCKWKDGVCELPYNPRIDRGAILTPKRFLRSIPVASSDGFWNWAWSERSEDLRVNMTYDILKHMGKRADNVKRDLKAKLARENPDIAVLYLRHLEDEEQEPYPVDEDPNLLVNWYEKGAEFSKHTPLSFLPEDRRDFCRFIEAVVKAYQHNIEEQDGWQLLWYEDAGREERAAQVLFRSSVIHYCRANDIDLTGESDAGRGPVDFKFSRGWGARALIEVKLARNTRFWDRILAQQPQYQKSEEIDCGYFVAIAYTDEHCSEKVRQKLARAADLVSKNSGFEIKPILVDARRKLSASKLRDEELADELHRPLDSADDTTD